MATPARGARRPRRTREEQKTERTQQLLESAWALFCERGYEALTIDHVAEHAGYSRMPIYSLFGDKQNLFFQLWRSAVGQLSELTIGALKPGVPLRKNLEELAKIIATSSASNQPRHGESLFFVVQTIALSRPPIAKQLEQLSTKVVQDFADAIRRSTLERGEALRSDPETVAAHLVAHINGMATVQFQTHRNYVKARDLIDIFCGIALKTRG